MKRLLKGLYVALVGGALCSVLSCTAEPKELSVKLLPTEKSAVFEEDGYYVWGASPIKGDDGLYHLFYSRWKKELGFGAWCTHSEVAHAVSKELYGPYQFRNVALPERGGEFWDGHCTHNPTVRKFGDKYYLYYMGNRGDRRDFWVHRNNQRIGVAVASDLNGDWSRSDQPLIDVSADSTAADAVGTNNPAVTQMPDGRYLMVYKCIAKKKPAPFYGPVGHLAAFADSPVGPFVKNDKVLFQDGRTDFPAEDPYIWEQDGRLYAIVKDMKGTFTRTGRSSLVLFESADGLDWQESKHLLVSEKEIRWSDGEVLKVQRLERPQLYIEKGEPKAIFLAVGLKGMKHTYNVHIPLEAE